jgi:nucleoid-associated protein YgaU
MKKFNTAAIVLALASAFLPLSAHAMSPSDEAHVNPTSVQCTFRQDAPDQHVVVRGDTLWGISGQFLDHPWCWPQVWGLNQEEIRNPHWIYPGQIVYFDRASGRLRLGTPVGESGGSASDQGMQRRIRTQGLDAQAIPSIPANIIEPFLTKPLIVTENELNTAPHIVAVEEGHVNAGKNDRAYIRGDLKDGTLFQAFRPSRPLKDPSTNKIIGYEAVYLGTLRVTRPSKNDDVASIAVITEAKEEMGAGDRLLPVPITPFVNYAPHSPSRPMNARVVSIYEGVTHAGQNNVVTVNVGKNNGADVGTVLQLYHFGGAVVDSTDKKKTIKLPDEEYGSLFVFRVFDNISYALVMEVRNTVEVGDVARTPE